MPVGKCAPLSLLVSVLLHDQLLVSMLLLARCHVLAYVCMFPVCAYSSHYVVCSAFPCWDEPALKASEWSAHITCNVRDVMLDANNAPDASRTCAHGHVCSSGRVVVVCVV